MPSPSDLPEQVDVLIVGAGLSGIGAARHLQRSCPDRSFAIVEARERLGGTWDLFRYPGVRSDSDMYTLGFSFRPWAERKAIADGPSILRYLQDTARETGIDRAIRYGLKARAADWSSADAHWTVTLEPVDGSAPRRLRCRFLYLCSGYYSYAGGHSPAFPGLDRFAGRVVHPQAWPQDLDYAGKRVVVIGSGATAVTLVPSMAATAGHVTMLQRSPTWMAVRPSVDGIAERLNRTLPARLAYSLVRWKNVLYGMWIYRLCKRRPQQVGDFLFKMVRERLPAGYDAEKHFRPRYAPWDQRLCLVPDDDFFKAIRDGRSSVVTDTIDTFDERGIRLHSGERLDADIVVTATGLELLFAAGLQVTLDGRPADLSKTLSYRGLMFSGVPNFAIAFGYTNASWTLKAELGARYVCRLLNRMAASGTQQVMPVLDDPQVRPVDWVDFTSGYIQRAKDRMPHQGSKRPWRLYQNYLLDLIALRLGSLDDGALRFAKAGEVLRSPQAAPVGPDADVLPSAPLVAR